MARRRGNPASNLRPHGSWLNRQHFSAVRVLKIVRSRGRVVAIRQSEPAGVRETALAAISNEKSACVHRFCSDDAATRKKLAIEMSTALKRRQYRSSFRAQRRRGDDHFGRNPLYRMVRRTTSAQVKVI